jgi:SAM-dependent methyltransferase
MAHESQESFVYYVKSILPIFFFDKDVIDIGSRDVNGNNRKYFLRGSYVGIDITEGKNVDVVCKGHEYESEPVDTVISTECFEHDMYWHQTIENMIKLTKPGGLLVFTCASTGRPEHGTRKSSLGEEHWDQAEWPDYYMNLTENHFRQVVNFDKIFSTHKFMQNDSDLYFYGIKGPE